jgi:large subunit ribosomal protein L10
LAISRARKEEILEEYRQQMAESSGLVMANYSMLTVPQMQELRQRARDQEGAVFVVKNTLFRLLLDEEGYDVSEDLIEGPIAVVFAHQDVPPLAKVFRDYAREAEEGQFEIIGGILEERIISADEATAIADLPSREELLSTVLRTINAPATQTAGVVAGGIRQVLNVINAYVDKLEEAEGAPAEAAA